MMTRAQFCALSPRDRGYATYMLGARSDEPHVPDEENPYPVGSPSAVQWDEGPRAGVLAAQDSEE